MPKLLTSTKQGHSDCVHSFISCCKCTMKSHRYDLHGQGHIHVACTILYMLWFMYSKNNTWKTCRQCGQRAFIAKLHSPWIFLLFYQFLKSNWILLMLFFLSVFSTVVAWNAVFCPSFRCGDMILSVNSVSLECVTHSKAVDVLKHATGAVSLCVVSWPGTAVWPEISAGFLILIGQSKYWIYHQQ